MGQLTLQQRYTIQTGLQLGQSQSHIAQTLAKNKSVISREIRRNKDRRSGSYNADLAHRKAQKRHGDKPKRKDFTSEVEQRVRTDLAKDLSPEQIVGLARKEGRTMVSVERIYQFVWADKKKEGTLYKHLRHQGKKYQKRSHGKQKRGIIKDRVDIDLRPAVVDAKERFGDLEIDLVIGKGHKQALLTINDRATGLLFMGKVLSKEAHMIERKTLELLENYKPFIQTITSDNGKEFAKHKNIAEALNIEFYFAKPYHSWQRGANENLNGLVRQYFPKNMSFQSISDEDINKVVEILNNRPRKRFDYLTPTQMLAKKIENFKPVAFIS